MADDRKIFPTESVIELIAGKDTPGADEVACFILDRSLASPAAIRAAAPFASAWLAQLYGGFTKLDLDAGQSRETLLSQAKNLLGDHISLTRMSGNLKNMAGQVLDEIRDMSESLATQTRAVAELEKRVKELQPLEAALDSARKKCGDLENQLREQKKEIGSLRRQVMEFDGKVAINHDDLLQNIKDAIKDGLKGLSIGSAVASTIEASAEAEASPMEEGSAFDDFGFGASRQDSDGFGF